MFRNNFMCVLMYDYPSVCVYVYNRTIIVERKETHIA